MRAEVEEAYGGEHETTRKKSKTGGDAQDKAEGGGRCRAQGKKVDTEYVPECIISEHWLMKAAAKCCIVYTGVALLAISLRDTRPGL